MLCYTYSLCVYVYVCVCPLYSVPSSIEEWPNTEGKARNQSINQLMFALYAWFYKYSHIFIYI